jgi:hypothetical protein
MSLYVLICPTCIEKRIRKTEKGNQYKELRSRFILYYNKVKNTNELSWSDSILKQSRAKQFQTADTLFFTNFSYFICGANSKNKAP